LPKVEAISHEGGLHTYWSQASFIANLAYCSTDLINPEESTLNLWLGSSLHTSRPLAASSTSWDETPLSMLHLVQLNLIFPPRCLEVEAVSPLLGGLA